MLSQSYSNLQIIIVDDGSKEECAVLCDELAKKDARIKVIHKKNEGQGIARNCGIEASCGEYIGFVDSDDWIKPYMYEKMYNAAKSNDSDIVFCNCQENDDGHIFTPEMNNGPYDREAIKKEIVICDIMCIR
mgnify:CR=1 FL=1